MKKLMTICFSVLVFGKILFCQLTVLTSKSDLSFRPEGEISHTTSLGVFSVAPLLRNDISPTSNTSTNELQKQFNLAKSLYDKEDYFDAITEFKRLLFFDKDSTYTFEANYKIGECYKEGAKFSKAILYFTYAEWSANNTNELYNSRISIVRTNILRRTTSNAVILLDSLQKDPRFYNKLNDINYWKGWAYIFADNWEQASEAFGKISKKQPLKKLCDKVISERYSVTAANILSVVLPGAGQIYTGNILSGMLSFGWNLLWGYITINSIVENRVLDGIFVGDLLWLRFYFGNLQNAKKFAIERNIEISNKALSYLQYKYQGEKP